MHSMEERRLLLTAIHKVDDLRVCHASTLDLAHLLLLL